MRRPAPSALRRSGALFLALCALGLSLSSCSDGAETASRPGVAAPTDARADAPGDGLVILDPTTPERPYFHDFGAVPFGGLVRHVYRLENTDPVPVTVRDVQASCGCTQPRLSYTAADGTLVQGDPLAEHGSVITIPPGAVAELDVRVDTELVQFKNKDKLASVHLRCDSANTPFLAFELHLVVDLAFQATPAKLELGRVGASAGGSARTDIVRDPPQSEARIVRVAEASPGLTATLEETIQLGRTVWVLVATLEPGAAERGLFSGRVDLETTDREGQPADRLFRVPVTAIVEDDYFLDPRSLGFRALEPGEPASSATVLGTHHVGHRFEVVDALVQGEDREHLSVLAEPIEPDGRGKSDRWRVTLSLAAGYDGPGVRGTVLLRLDDERTPSVTIPYLGRVKRPAAAAADPLR